MEINKETLKVIKDTQREQEFTFNYIGHTVTVESNFLDDFDNFSVTVYLDSPNKLEEDMILHGVFDSAGGTYGREDFEDFSNFDEEVIDTIKNFVLDTLFGETGLISKYDFNIDEQGHLIESNITLSRLIKHLENIYNKYGDMPVEGNIISGDRGYVSSLCVMKDDSYEEQELSLLIEVEGETKGTPVFDVYEYPSMNEINLK